MTTWLQFLAQHGARLSDTALPEVLNFGIDSFDQNLPADFIAPLAGLGLIAVSGEEAANFLHKQLTNDVEHLEQAEARLAGYCTPKGRLLATFDMWKSGDAIMLLLPGEIQATVQKRLQMFVLRARVKLEDVTQQHVVFGLAGTLAAAALTQWFPLLPATPGSKTDSAAGTLIRAADLAGMPRYQWITTPECAMQAWPTLTETLQPAGAHIWRLTNIQAGIPHVTSLTQEKFVPQMINFELIGGVNFKKGCYPGQEIVARSQYLGKLKRRMLLASIATQEVEAGMEVFSPGDPEQPCGMIVNTEKRSQDVMDCLVEIKLAVLESGGVHLGTADGPELLFRPLPYALPDPA